MKLILLAAAAAIAGPAFAQTTTPADQTTTPAPADQTMTPAPADQTTTPADPAAAAPATDPSMQTAPAPATTATDPGMTQPPMASTTTPEAAATAGGYQPAAPALQGGATPGGPVVFRAAPSPTEAFPPPAPMAKYPICKKGEFDNCMQGPRSTHSREVRGRSSK